MKEKPVWPISLSIVLVTSALATYYILLSYPDTGNSSQNNYTTFLINKIFAFEGLLLLSFSYITVRFPKISSGSRPDYLLPKFLGLAGALFTFVHVVLSLEILNPFFFPKLFTHGVLNPRGIGSLVSGMTAFVFILLPAYGSFHTIRSVTHRQWKKMQRTGYLGLLTFLIHAAVLDGNTGFIQAAIPAGCLRRRRQPSSWH
jgi:DMSO/TMAO reductase YedYZ heme-binding membrane subunit